MTDAEINARVAALHGDTIAQDDDGWYIVGEGGHRWPAPNYCGDPAAWGGLLVWLAGEGLKPELNRRYDSWFAQVAKTVGWITQQPVRYHAYDTQPGRALALAALKAHGVAVE